MNPRILIAGIGNIFLGDDAFGVEVVRRLMQRTWPEGVRVADYSIRGFDLAFALMDEYDAFILIDAVPRGEEPGTLYTIEVDVDAVEEATSLEAHSLDPLRVLQMVKSMGGRPKRVLLIGCEPEQFGERMGLSATVEASVEEAVRMAESLINLTVEQAILLPAS